jgi:hypothetical protein
MRRPISAIIEGLELVSKLQAGQPPEGYVREDVEANRLASG